jgi:hypothetical protein
MDGILANIVQDGHLPREGATGIGYRNVSIVRFPEQADAIARNGGRLWYAHTWYNSYERGITRTGRWSRYLNHVVNQFSTVHVDRADGRASRKRHVKSVVTYLGSDHWPLEKETVARVSINRIAADEGVARYVAG